NVELVSSFQVARGLILASNGRKLAVNRRVRRNGVNLYFRRYPQLGLAAQTIGYSTSARSQTGLELTLNDYLTGSNTNLSNEIRGVCGGSSALLDRATDGLFTPGSTFKMVTAAAALDTGAFTPTSGFEDPGYCTEYHKPVYNAGNPDQNGPEAYGHVTLAQGFQHSFNSVF